MTDRRILPAGLTLPRLKPSRPGALFLVSLCFLGSGALRIWDSDLAIAAETDPKPAAMATEQAQPLGQCPPQLEPESLLVAIQNRERQLKAMEQRLADREQILRVSTIKIEEQLKALEATEKKLSKTLSQADKAAEKDIDRITSVYENMKPANAAEIFETMDVTFAAGFLMRMRPEAAAGILSNLSPEAAYSVSVVMAGRNASVPTE